MTALDDFTTSQLVEAAIGDLDLVRRNVSLVPTLDENLNMVNAFLEELGKRVNGIWEVKL